MRNRKALRAATYLGWILLLLFFVWTAAFAMMQDAREECGTRRDPLPVPVVVGPHGFFPG